MYRDTYWVIQGPIAKYINKIMSKQPRKKNDISLPLCSVVQRPFLMGFQQQYNQDWQKRSLDDRRFEQKMDSV